MNSSGQNAVPGNGMRIVVTGGAGFLGSHVCAKLLQRGCSVLAIDNLSTGNMGNITPLFGRGDFHFVQHDIVSPVALQADWIFNMACCAAPRHCLHDPEKTVRNCTDGVLNLLREAQACHARIFQASTGEVYGKPDVDRTRRHHDVIELDWSRSCYNEGTRYAEAMFFDFHQTRGLDIKVARIFNTYGPHMQIDDGNMVSGFIVRALRNQPLAIPADGGQTRSFCYVDDLVDGILRLMAAPKPLTGPVNLGSPAAIAVADLARRIIGLTGSRSRIVRQPVQADDSSEGSPDISLARTALDWSPRVSLDVGLTRTIKWFDTMLSQARHIPAGVRAIA